MSSSESSSSETSDDEAEQWRPSCGAFRAYTAADQHQGGAGQPARDVPIVVKLTKDIIGTYHSCNALYHCSDIFNPKIYLTDPYVPSSNGGFDNENRDLILAVNGVLYNEDTNHRYIIKGLLGHGTFGQVAKCWRDEKNDFVAVKVIKNHPAYGQQAIVEISILYLLNGHYDPDDTHHIVRIVEHFTYKDHLCIVFEMLGLNLYELLKANNLRGISLNLIRNFSKQILIALALLKDAGVIHCDLKPENILLTTHLESAQLKIIDFGSACKENRTIYSYIQSRHYRSPEVVLGHGYTTAIDMWSFGCIAVELFLGLPLFPAESQYDLLQRTMKILGSSPPDHILTSSKNTSKYFQQIGAPCLYSEHVEGHRSAYQFLTPEDYEKRQMTMPVIGKHIFSEDWDLEKVIKSYPLKDGMSPKEIEEELQKRVVFTDFIKGVLNFDPMKRWTPRQAAGHPFVTHMPFTGQFQPPLEALQMPVHRGMNVDHNPISGHWLGAGLSPLVNAMVPLFGSPHYHQQYFSDGSSLGSAGSYQRYGDGYRHSVGDRFGGPLSHQVASTARNSAFGLSPDTRWHSHRAPDKQVLGLAHVGLSPSSTFLPPLGASPMSHFQHALGSASTGSPSRFWPSSPARSSCSGASSLGKAAALGQFNKRRGWDGSPVSTMYAGNSGACLRPQTQTHKTESLSGSYIEDTSPLASPHTFSDQRFHISTTNTTVSYSDPQTEAHRPPIYPTDCHEALISNTQLAFNSGDDLLPAHWDPNFSEDLLLGNEEAEAQPGKFKTHSSSLVDSSLLGNGAFVLENPSNSNKPNAGMLQYAPHFSAHRQISDLQLVDWGMQPNHDYRWCSYTMQQVPHVLPGGLMQKTNFIPQQQQQVNQHSEPNLYLYRQPPT